MKKLYINLKILFQKILWINRALIFFAYIYTYLNKINESDTINTEFSDNSIIILLTPWYLTNIPWYSCILALALNKRGSKILIIVDDLQININQVNPTFQVFFIKILIHLIKKRLYIKNIFLSNINDGQVILSDFELLNLCDTNLAHAFMGRQLVGTSERLKMLNQLKKIEKKVSKIVHIFNKATFVVPNGILGSAGIFSAVVKNINSNDLRITSFDSGLVNETIFAYSGIAAFFSDIPIFFNLRKDKILKINENIINSASKLQKQRRAGHDKLQGFRRMRNVPEITKNFILICPNVAWDSAALLSPGIFSTHEEWIISTIEYILYNSNYDIKVRIHPAESLFKFRSMPKLNEKIEQKFANLLSRIQIFEPDSNVDTYYLIEKCNGVVVHNSTVGLEAILLGVPSLFATETYFTKILNRNAPENRNDYFINLAFLITRKEGISKDELHYASLCYILGQKYSYQINKFMSPSSTFWWWITIPLNKLIGLEYFNEIDEGISIGYSPQYDYLFD
jgi:hypothetical protein